MPNLAPAPGVQRSALSFIKSALRLVGSLRAGQNLTADEQNDALQVANDLLDAWSAKRLMVFAIPYTTQDQNGNTLTLVAGLGHYTLGNVLGTENFLMNRPARIERVSVMYSASQQTPVEVPMEMYDSVAWQGVANKTTPSLIPRGVYIEANANAVDFDLYFWPVPTQANPVVLYPWALLSQFPNLQTQFSFPPAYARAIRYNLAVDLAAEFPGDPQKLQLVMKIAKNALDDVASINSPIKEAWCDEAIVNTHGSRGNIYTGTPTRSHNF
jgi:hypothetical protein